MLAGSPGVSAMPIYRLYRIDGSGKIESADWLEADGDNGAVDEARQRVGHDRFELWERFRRVDPPKPRQS